MYNLLLKVNSKLNKSPHVYATNIQDKKAIAIGTNQCITILDVMLFGGTAISNVLVTIKTNKKSGISRKIHMLRK